MGNSGRREGVPPRGFNFLNGRWLWEVHVKGSQEDWTRPGVKSGVVAELRRDT